MADDGLVRSKLTDESIELMRRRIGYPNPTLRGGIITKTPWNTVATADTIRHWAIGIGDDNPLFTDAEYGETTRWGGMIAPPGYETTMGYDRSKKMDPEFEKETSKVLRGFYTRNEFRAWDTLQRLHWDIDLAHKVGVQSTYDIGPQRNAMVCQYSTNFAGDNAWVYRTRCEYRNFNFVGDTTWIQGEVIEARVDEKLGPLLELKITGTNQRGQENIRASATILCGSRAHGELKLPPTPPMPEHRS